MKQTLTLEQDQALRAFAEEHGRSWKQALRDVWMRGSDTGALREIRDTFGPSAGRMFTMKQTPALAKFIAEVERNYAVSSVVARITARNVRECVYTTCDDRAAQALAQYARGMGLGTMIHADSMAPNATYTITIL